MSLWLSGRDRSGRTLWWLIDADMAQLIIPIGLAAAILIPNINLHPLLFLKAALALMSAGALGLIRAKSSLFRQGVWASWGYGRMSRWNARWYKASYAVMLGGVILLLIIDRS
jgi:hypothetical protein